MSLQPFSDKQKTVLTWWCRPETKGYDAIICDGAVRSGKTTALSLGFVFWACTCFSGQSFALCGKTVTGIRRNLVLPLCQQLRTLGFHIEERVSRSYLDISFAGHTNRFYCFGGKDEGAAAFIQGITLAGVLLDEAALMPRSFVEQAAARCSVPGARLWFSCNPEQPSHWFYREWICNAKQKHALYLHFTMDDNNALTPAVKRRYERLYQGAFYDRYVKGIWTTAQGLVYPMFRPALHVGSPDCEPERFVISCDYGTMNPASFGLWGLCRGCWFRIAESYYDAGKTGLPRTDEEHYEALCALAGNRKIEQVVVDPSAASFITCIRRHGTFRAVPAKNDVLGGIRRTADAIRNGEIKIGPDCADSLREFSLYVWDAHAGRDAPKKENDHAMDDIRYFVATVIDAPCDDAFFAASVARG
ncbi:MAG: PBSX family phage terminase large subunit [Oscillospiraceae bacterium]|nr:PBSX family phage terminase large subunit [Oscillospiraceae bacterium]